MTEKQVQRVKDKIDKYKKALAAERKYFGGLHDGQGVRYLFPELFIKIRDYRGGLKYLRWFDKNFPRDICDPIFLFERSFILFKCSKFDDAKRAIEKTFYSSAYLLEKFLLKELTYIDKEETPILEIQSVNEHFHYSLDDLEFKDFSEFLESFLQTEEFLDKVKIYLKLKQELNDLPVGNRRTKVVEKLSKLQHD